MWITLELDNENHLNTWTSSRIVFRFSTWVRFHSFEFVYCAFNQPHQNRSYRMFCALVCTFWISWRITSIHQIDFVGNSPTKFIAGVQVLITTHAYIRWNSCCNQIALTCADSSFRIWRKTNQIFQPVWNKNALERNGWMIKHHNQSNQYCLAFFFKLRSRLYNTLQFLNKRIVWAWTLDDSYRIVIIRTFGIAISHCSLPIVYKTESIDALIF